MTFSLTVPSLFTFLTKKFPNTVKLHIFVRYPFSYFGLETGSYELTFVLSRASKHNNIEIRWPQDRNKFSSSIKFRTFFKSTKLSTVQKFVTLQYISFRTSSFDLVIFWTIDDWHKTSQAGNSGKGLFSISTFSLVTVITSHDRDFGNF